MVARWLKEDEQAPRKQRHTAKRIHDRLKELGYEAGESTVRQLVRELRDTRAEAYVPLAFDPGEAVQVDWGEAKVYLDGVLTRVYLFCMRLCYSCAPFVMAFPNQREEAFLEGHRRGFEFFGGVPRRAIYDNTKNAVKVGWGKWVTEENPRFRALRAHYAFQADFCNPGAGHEKALVEGLVGYIRRNVLVPLPRVKSWDELQAALEERCRQYSSHRISGREAPVGVYLAEEQAFLTILPRRPFETALVTEAKVRQDATVTFDRNRYSVPVNLVGFTLTVKGYPLRVEVYQKNNLVAVHPRLYGQGRYQFELAHYLPLLEQRPRSLLNARPLKETLPPVFWAYYRQLSGLTPEREFLAILKLIPAHGLARVARAVEKAAAQHQYSCQAVRLHLEEEPVPLPLPPAIPGVQAVDLKPYDLLAGGGVP
jgi:transposase